MYISLRAVGVVMLAICLACEESQSERRVSDAGDPKRFSGAQQAVVERISRY